MTHEAAAAAQVLETLPVPTVTAQAESVLPAGPLLLRPEESCAFVIFGASGDLTGRKLIPALYNLFCQDLLPPGFAVVGHAVTPFDDDSFRARMRELVQHSPEVLVFRPKLWDAFARCLHYISADFASEAGYRALGARVAEMDRDHGTSGNRLFYLATSPSFYGTITENLGVHGLVTRASEAHSDGWTRVVVEKPFGHDLASARRLNETMHTVLDEKQIFRIDHYLGKETVQNLLAFRFVNAIIEPIWDRRYVDHVQITAAEKLGVEHRGGYYEEAGCLRDMFQNHLLQLMALVAMDPPVRYGSQSVRDRKADVLRAILPLAAAGPSGAGAVRGQYGPGTTDGAPVPGYRDERDVAPDSHTGNLRGTQAGLG
jgi:glucose-6-phosphate 1-dehydrogenase